MKLQSFCLPALIGALSVSVFACQAGSGDTGSGGAGTGAQSTGSGTSQGGTGGKQSATSTTGAFMTGSNAQTGVGGGCAATSVQTQLVQLDMVVILDESGSMEGTKWTQVTTALKSFITDSVNDGIGVGIVYFPNFQADDCNPLDYENLNVDVAPLPGNAQHLVDSINGEMPQGGTPTWGALKGGLARATALQDLHPDHKVIVVFASDGDPSSCAIESIPQIAALSASAYNYNGVRTYVIAMQGATLANLDQIAAAGGTTQAYDVTMGAQAFSQKMQDIRSSALSCQFVIPPPPMGQTLDPNLVNLTYTAGGSTVPQQLPRADGLSDCGSGPGWYYDNPTAPTQILLCPASCQTVQADSQAKVDVAFGCVSVPN